MERALALFQTQNLSVAARRVISKVLKWVGRKAIRLALGLVISGTAVATLYLLWEALKAAEEFTRTNPGAGGWETALNVLLSGLKKTWRAVRDFFQMRVVSGEDARRVLRSIPLSIPTARPDHSHPGAASLRAGADAFVRNVATALGKRVYSYQLSKSQAAAGALGANRGATARDLTFPLAKYAPSPNDVVYLREDDHYADMNAFLASNCNVVAIYRFSPLHGGASTREYSYSFNSDGVVTLRVAGGAEYSHQLWDYQGDRIVCIDGCATTYLVERVRLPGDFEIVWLFPDTVWGLGALTRAQVSMLVWGPSVDPFAGFGRVRRFNPIQDLRTTEEKVLGDDSFLGIPGAGTYVRFCYQTSEGSFTTTALTSVPMSTTIPTAVDSEIISGCTKGGVVSLAMVKSFAGDCKQDVTPLAHYLARLGQRQATAAGLPYGPPACLTFEYVAPKNHPDPASKPVMRQFMPPLVVGETYVPLRTSDNEAMACYARLQAVKVEIPLTQWDLQLISEFVEQCALATGSPPHGVRLIDLEELRAGLNNPRARAQFDLWSEFADQGRSSKSFDYFLKAESYDEVKAPRGIANPNAEEKFLSGRVWRTVANELVKLPFYGFVRPSLLYNRMTEASKKGMLHDLDGSKFEGRVGPAARYLEEALARRMIHQDDHPPLTEELKRGYGRVIRGMDIVFNMDYQRASGHAATAVGNSIYAAYIQYKAWRSSSAEHKQQGFGPADSFARIGMVGGDDMVAVVDETASAGDGLGRFLRSGESLGMVLTVGEGHVTFLGRIYGALNSGGDANSCASPMRVLRQLHVSGGALEDPLTKLMEKLRSIAITDSNTPLLGYLASMSDGRPEGVSWQASVALEHGERVENQFDNWMLEPEVLGMDHDEYQKVHDFLSRAKIANLLTDHEPLIYHQLPAELHTVLAGIAPMVEKARPAPSLTPMEAQAIGELGDELENELTTDTGTSSEAAAPKKRPARSRAKGGQKAKGSKPDRGPKETK